MKGITYSLQSFLGPQTWNPYKKPEYEYDSTVYQNTLLANKDNISTELYHCIIYLAPGDYHRFHSPAQWKINYRRHFPGKLLSVRPTFASWFPSLSTLMNESFMSANGRMASSLWLLSAPRMSALLKSILMM